jgi:integrase
VDERKLLGENPWNQFTWIEGAERPIRQFDDGELFSVLDYLGKEWPGVTVAGTLAKVLLWSWGRREEVTSLRWSSLKVVGEEYHFETTGKHGVEKWFRVPPRLYKELLDLKTDSPFVFAAYNDQLRNFYLRAGRDKYARIVAAEFHPVRLGAWFHERLKAWSAGLPKGHATMHIFRKTTMQHAHQGRGLGEVAAGLQISPGVMMTNYVKQTDELRRQESNRTFQSILASLSPEVARRYGHVPTEPRREDRLKEAVLAGDWTLAARLSAELARVPAPVAG